MLDLNPAVQFQEEELAPVEHELGGAGAHVADRARKAHRGLAHLRAQLRIESGRRRFLEHLLVPPLHRAVALAERDDRAVRVREQLDLDMPRPLDQPLEVDAIVAERGSRLAPRGLERRVELAGRADDPHASAAAAGSGLHDQRRLRRVGHRGYRLGRSDPLRLELVAAAAEGSRGWPDPGEPGGRREVRELRILGEEPVAGMDRVCARCAGSTNLLERVEVRHDLDRLVGRARVQGAEVVMGDDRDRRHAEGARRAEHA